MTSENFETGMYLDRADAETAVERLHNLKYTDQDISVVMDDQVRAREFATTTGSMAAEGAGTGALVGGGLGAMVAGVATMAGITAVVSTGGFAAPFVMGPLAVVLAGLSGGLVTGGIVGGLVGAGIPKEQAEFYEKSLAEGGILLGVNAPPERLDEVRRVFANAQRSNAQPV